MPRSLAERFKPSLPERLKQSAEAKTKRREPPPRPAPLPKSKDVIHKGQIYPNGTTYQTVIHGQSLTNLEVRQVPTMVSMTSNRDIWSEWTTGHRFTTHAECWDTWQTGYATAHTTSLVETWVRWQTSDGQTGYARAPGGISMSSRQRIEVAESEEMKKERLDREARWKAEDEVRRAEAAKARKIQEAADARAMELLHSCMSVEQQETLRVHGFFYVKAKSGRKYRIDKGTHGNVKVVDKDNRVIERLCIQPNGVPVGDSMLAQKLLIETAEDVFRRHANITLNNGQVIWAPDKDLLTGDKLAPVINIFTKEAVQQSLQPVARVG